MGCDVISRRTLVVAGVGLLAASPSLADPANGHGAAAGAHSHAEPGMTPAAALSRLLAGNARYVSGRSIHPDVDVARRQSLVGGQHPFATILACADSRVAPEILFDQGLGDLFTVRVAGNVIDDAVQGSIEYAVVHLACPLVMVLGHQSCGAVTATMSAVDGKGSAEDAETKIGALAALIAPAVRAVPKGAPDRLDAAIVLNAQRQASQLLAMSAPVRERVRAGKLKVVSARYGLTDGKVTALKDA
jgi:carbonic anhydrase